MTRATSCRLSVNATYVCLRVMSLSAVAWTCSLPDYRTVTPARSGSSYCHPVCLTVKDVTFRQCTAGSLFPVWSTLAVRLLRFNVIVDVIGRGAAIFLLTSFCPCLLLFSLFLIFQLR